MAVGILYKQNLQAICPPLPTTAAVLRAAQISSREFQKNQAANCVIRTCFLRPTNTSQYCCTCGFLSFSSFLISLEIYLLSGSKHGSTLCCLHVDHCSTCRDALTDTWLTTDLLFAEKVQPTRTALLGHVSVWTVFVRATVLFVFVTKKGLLRVPYLSTYAKI